jgi:GntR family transcriptional regulator
MVCHSTHVIPFRLTFAPGLSLYEQVVYAAKKAMLAGQLSPGDPFPSVRALSKALKINPNTAHKVIAQLVEEKLLEVRPGTGTVVAVPPASSRVQRRHLLADDLEKLVVAAMQLGLEPDDLAEGIREHWQRLQGTQRPAKESK